MPKFICDYCKFANTETKQCYHIGYDKCQGDDFIDKRIEDNAIGFIQFIEQRCNTFSAFKIDTGHVLTVNQLYKMYESGQTIESLEREQNKEFIVIKIGINVNVPKSLGDFLVFNPLPKLLKECGYKKVYLSLLTPFRNEGIGELITCNPYIDGVINMDATIKGLDIDTIFTQNLYNQSNIVPLIQKYYGIDVFNRTTLPELYYNPNIKEDYSICNIYDPNCFTDICGANLENITAYFEENNIKIDYQFIGRDRYQIVLPDVPIIETSSIFQWIDILASAKNTYSLFTGVNVVMAALNKNKTHTVLYKENTDPCLNFWKFDNVNYVQLK